MAPAGPRRSIIIGMIARDQPTCFPGDVTVRVSSKQDGSVLSRVAGRHAPEYVARRVEICRQAGVDYADAVYQRIVYANDQTYDKIVRVGGVDTTRHAAEVAADALVTDQKHVALFLPVADCAATVMYDPVRHVLALAHLGRHSTYAKLAASVTKYFIHDGSDPADLIVWMSPHAQKTSYKLDWFDKADDPDWQGFYERTADGAYLDMAGFNKRLFENSGVLSRNIYVSPVDTMKDPAYFSHAAGDTAGRIAVVAVMR